MTAVIAICRRAFSRNKWRAATLLACLAMPVTAIERIELGLGLLQGDGWAIEGLDAGFEWNDAGGLEWVARATQLRLAETTLHALSLRCRDFSLSRQQLACADGHLAFTGGAMPSVSTPVRFSYDSRLKIFRLQAERVAVAGGNAALAFTQQPQGWTLQVTLNALQPAQLLPYLSGLGVAVPDLALKGQFSGRLVLDGVQQRLRRVDWRLETRQLAYANASGTQAGENLHLSSHGTARRSENDWRADIELVAQGGMLFSDPLYFEYRPGGEQTLHAKLRWQAHHNILDVEQLDVRHAQVVSGRARARIALHAQPALQLLDIDISQGHLPGFYTTYLQPWLTGTGLDDIESTGELSGRLVWKTTGLDALQVQIQNASIHEPGGLFGVETLIGDIHWDSSDTPRDSVLTWQGARVRNIPLGKSRLAIRSNGRQARITEPLSMDLLDGRLHVDEFNIGWSDQAGVHWQLDGVLSPVSMEAFTAAIGWPRLSGRLSGVIPRVAYRAGELGLGGTLLVQAFDGAITVRNLKVQQPLGLVPRLWADAKADNIDLDTLTRQFSFGRIEGRLQGEVNGLYMEAWQPVAFDAHFETPPDDTSRHRISQKAVDSISNLGGSGVSGALSRGFLRFLKDFPYRRLGIRCRLENGICQMDGVAPASDGYYLVQGRLIPPRLDMIGHEHRVDWPSLVKRLMAVTQGPASGTR